MASSPFLTFNPTFNKGTDPDFGLPEDDEEWLEALRSPMQLKDTWVLWEQVVSEGNAKNASFADALRNVVAFNTVQDFWRIWNGLPQPSALLDQRRILREGSGSNGTVAVDAIMLFKQGVKPQWEHPANAQGGCFQIQMKPNSVPGPLMDEYWNNTVLGMIGGTIEPNDMINGIRLVDKLSGSGPKGANVIRIELWFGRCTETSVNQLKKSMERCMAMKLDGSLGTPPKADLKPHGTHTPYGKH